MTATDVRRAYLDLCGILPTMKEAKDFIADQAPDKRAKLIERLPELYYDPRSLDLEAVKRSSLHAKCIVVDRRVALVTSANFTEAAQERNIEVGVLIRSRAFAEQLAEHFEVLAAQGALLPILH